LAAVLAGKPISVAVRRAAEARHAALKGDRAFVQRYLAGDQEARRTMTTVHALLAAKVEQGAA
jgi:hypothetical protein